MSRPPNNTDEELDHLVEELAALQPAAPTDGLHGRVCAALREAAAAPAGDADGDEGRQRLRRLWLGGLPVALAASLALLAAVLVEPAGPVDEAPAAAGQVAGSGPWQTGYPQPRPLELSPVSAESRLIGEDEEGLSQDPNGVYTRQLRRRYLETRILRDTRSGALIEIEVPREEVLRLPVRSN
jgi:hypothetical protein